jgi:NtrC-family two-component system response regulator AlgB
MHRLSSMVIRLRPLRDRPEDILGLSEHFLTRSTNVWNTPRTLTPGGRSVLLEHRWPGNVRELRQVLIRASVVCSKGRITEEHLRWALNIVLEGYPVAEEASSLSHMDREILRLASLEPAQRGRGRRVLGMPKSTFYRRLKGLERPRSSAG